MKIRNVFITFVAAGLLTCLAAPCTARAGGGDGGKMAAQYSDTWLKAKLLTTYTLNLYLNPFDIHVGVKDGVVTLRGKVDTSVEKDLAVEIAKGMDGVKAVHDELAIAPTTQAPLKERTSFSQMVKDATITAKVKSRLLWNRNIEGLHIDVETNHGVVVLSGRIGSAIKRELAFQLARNTSGVKKVVDRLRVVGGEQTGTAQETGEMIKKEVSDAWITGKVKAVLLASKEAEGADIEVSTHNKVVTLSGTVKNKEQQDKVMALVADVIGVEHVKSKLTFGSN